MSIIQQNIIVTDPQSGEIEDTIRDGQEWLIKANGTYWTGILDISSERSKLSKGDPIQVVGRKGIKLLIK